jgi:lipoprotein-anchoring transpeptidase ErfK/SrfK
MDMTRIARLATGAATLLGLTALAGEAAAQYYPRGTYDPPEPYYSRPARPLPPPTIIDDEVDAPPPGVYSAPSSPYRRDPPVARYPLESQPTDRAYPDRGYSDRNTYSDRGYPDRTYPDRNTYSDRGYDGRGYDGRGYDGRGVPPPPAYEGRGPYDARPPYTEPYDRAPTGALPAPAPGTRRDDGFPRPPGDIGAGAPPAPIGPGGPASPAPAGERGTTVAALPPDYRPEEGAPKELAAHLRRQEVAYPTNQPAGTVIIDTPNTYLYYVLGNGRAMRYGVGVGRDGFTWSGTERISKMTEWPDWFPPKEMIERQPYLPRFMAGGTQNPLGARALYLGKTLYRIHGTNQPSTIGQFVSSGCIRLLNDDVEDLFRRVQVGTRVVVVASGNAQMLSSLPTTSAPGSKPAKPKQAAKPPQAKVPQAKVPQAKVSTGLPPPAPTKTAPEQAKAQELPAPATPAPAAVAPAPAAPPTTSQN